MDHRVYHLRFAHCDEPIAFVVRGPRDMKLPDFLYGVSSCAVKWQEHHSPSQNARSSHNDHSVESIRSQLVTVTDMGMQKNIDFDLALRFHHVVLKLLFPRDAVMNVHCNDAEMDCCLAPASEHGVDVNLMKETVGLEVHREGLQLIYGVGQELATFTWESWARKLAATRIVVNRGRTYVVLNTSGPASRCILTTRQGGKLSLLEYADSIGQTTHHPNQPVLDCCLASDCPEDLSYDGWLEVLQNTPREEFAAKIKVLLPEYTRPHALAKSQAWMNVLPMVPSLLHVLDEYTIGQANIASNIRTSLLRGDLPTTSLWRGASDKSEVAHQCCVGNSNNQVDNSKFSRDVMIDNFVKAREINSQVIGLFDESNAVTKIFALCSLSVRCVDECQIKIAQVSTSDDFAAAVEEIETTFNSFRRRDDVDFTNLFYGVCTALTTSGHNHPIFVHERLEWLGDAILSFVAAIKSIVHHEVPPSSREEAKRRQNQLCANMLLSECVSQHFPDWVANVKWDRVKACKSTNKRTPPPHYLRRSSNAYRKIMSNGQLSSKQVANCAEAMIGVVALLGDLPATYQFLEEGLRWRLNLDEDPQCDAKKSSEFACSLREHIGSAAFSLYISCLVYEMHPHGRESVLHEARNELWQHRGAIARNLRGNLLHGNDSQKDYSDEVLFYKIFFLKRHSFGVAEPNIRKIVLSAVAVRE
jgi:dsRNA-specific ribonuclease